MKTLLSTLILLIGGIVLYFLFNYALTPPKNIIKEQNKTLTKSESSVINSYLTKIIDKRKKEINKTSHKNLSINSVLPEQNKSAINPKKLFEKINFKKNSDKTKKLNKNKLNETINYTIEGTIKPPNAKKTKKKLTKKERLLLKAKKEPLNTRLKALKAQIGDSVYIRIFKKSKELEVWIKPSESKTYKLLKIYRICKYSGPLGPKLKEGDGVSPEGFYSVDYGALNPNSRYHLSFNIGFPNKYDINHGRTGSYLMVHGGCVSTGCYAMGDKNIEEIYKLVKEALLTSQSEVKVHIFPFRLEKKRLSRYKKNRWYKFWLNLKESYDAFNKNHIPPDIEVDGLKYIVNDK